MKISLCDACAPTLLCGTYNPLFQRLVSNSVSAYKKRGKIKMKKTLLCILLAALLAFSFAACGKRDDGASTTANPSSSENESVSGGGQSSGKEENTTIPANAPEEDVVGIKETFS